MSSAGFYRAFEERFYAPREIIKGLRQQYLPFVEPLAALYPGAMAFDIGCGRGEWLEILLELGLSPFGMDLDEGMLQGCVDLSLPAAQGDAVAHLATLADQSQAAITAFHVVEHIPFEQLQALVVQALRVLKPGGLLIMETPNPENIAVATRNFWLDPTHIRPLPPMLLAFLPEFHGFARVSTLRLQEPSDIHARSDIALTDVLHHVSPDYAVVAQKAAAPEAMAAFDSAFAADKGVDLHNLANRFDLHQSQLLAAHHETRQQIIAARQQLESAIEQAHADADSLRTELRELQASFAAAQSDFRFVREDHAALREAHEDLRRGYAVLRDEHDALRDAHTVIRNDHEAMRDDHKVLLHERNALLHECNAFRNSLSWTITAPLRGLGGFAASPLSYTMRQVLKYPHLSERINAAISKFPGLHSRLRGKAISQGLMTAPVTPVAPPPSPPATLADLSPRALEIYQALQQALARGKP